MPDNVVRIHPDDLATIAKNVQEQFLTIPQEFSDLLRVGQWQQRMYGITDPMQILWLQIDIGERTFSLSFFINEGRLLDRFVFNRPLGK